MPARVIDIPELRNRRHVFLDRAHAGRLLAGILGEHRGGDALLLAIPAGGVPVAVALGECLTLDVDVAVVSKITLPWNTEAGYGAVAFDGTVLLNDALLARTDLDERLIADGIEQTRRKVERRVASMRRDLPPLDVSERRVIIVDDGLASGFTMRVAVEALGRQHPASIVIAVPTGHTGTVAGFGPPVDTVYCANVRSGWSFAVADAYRRWRDVGEEEAMRALHAARFGAP